MATERKTILILGAAHSGLNAAHYLLKRVLPSLPADTYRILLVNPSPDFFWRMAGPRVVASDDALPRDRTFFPILDGFQAYPADAVDLLVGTATAWDPAARTVTVQPRGGDGDDDTKDGPRAIAYDSLILATGWSAASPLFNLDGDAAALREQQAAFVRELTDARTVVVGGGGPVAVETAGEIGEALNGAAGWFGTRPAGARTRVLVVTKAGRLLPVLSAGRARKAEGYLRRVGVDVLYGAKVVRVEKQSEGHEGKLLVHLSNGEKMTADVYLDATGVTPNSGYVPAEFKNDNGFVKTDPKTLQVTGAGERVYVVGDVGEFSMGGVIQMNRAIPVAMTNLKNDLLRANGQPGGPPAEWKRNDSESQMVPVGRRRGVAAVAGWGLPWFVVWLAKGRDYFLFMSKGVTHGGNW